MEYKEEKELEDFIQQMKVHDRCKYYELLLLKEIYDKLNNIEPEVTYKG